MGLHAECQGRIRALRQYGSKTEGDDESDVDKPYQSCQFFKLLTQLSKYDTWFKVETVVKFNHFISRHMLYLGSTAKMIIVDFLYCLKVNDSLQLGLMFVW